ncbi:MAG TPA: hypothetical protein VMF91_00895 [Bryobacteraceae bacterium]|nr:hypothetical protein [Bryobacteraceae bacterium]
MSLLTYINKPVFTSAVQQQLRKWYGDLQGVHWWEFVRQNIDRECFRTDIDPTLWDQFLMDVAAQYPKSRHALNVMKAAVDAKSTTYFLPGRQFAPSAPQLYRYMLLDQFITYSTDISGVDMPTAKKMIDDGRITGTRMEGRVFGKQIGGRNYAVWCADDSLASETQGEKARDRLGLKHIAGGYILEIEYPLNLLRARNMKICPPTVPDVVAEGADNWIWVKNRKAGGPGWGYTVDMTGGGAGAEGIPEALHAPFTVGAGEGAGIRLRVLDPFSKTAPQMDHGQMVTNAGL